MKKSLLFAAVAVLALGACSKNEVIDNSENHAIGFNNYTGRNLTKADGSYIGNSAEAAITADDSPIGVYANTARTQYAAAAADANFMSNVSVTMNGATASDNYSPLQYWPKDEANMISFSAYYPYVDVTTTPTSGITSLPGALVGNYGFTADLLAANQMDFMVASVVPNIVYGKKSDKTTDNTLATASFTQSNIQGAVKFTFKHQLTKVVFKINENKEYESTEGGKVPTLIKLKSVKVAGINRTNTLTTAFAADGSTTATWGTPGTPSEYTLFSQTTEQQISTTARQIADGNYNSADDSDDYVYLMLPQTLSDDAVVTITYTTKTGDYDALEQTVTAKLNEAVDATNTAISTWTANNSIVYTFTIGLNEIKFVGNVGAWDDVTSGTINFN